MLYAAQPEVSGSCLSQAAMHRVATTMSPATCTKKRYSASDSGPRRSDATATINRGTSIRQFELASSDVSALPAASGSGERERKLVWESLTYNEKNAEHPRRTPTDFHAQVTSEQANAHHVRQKRKAALRNPEHHFLQFCRPFRDGPLFSRPSISSRAFLDQPSRRLPLEQSEPADLPDLLLRSSSRRPSAKIAFPPDNSQGRRLINASRCRNKGICSPFNAT